MEPKIRLLLKPYYRFFRHLKEELSKDEDIYGHLCFLHNLWFHTTLISILMIIAMSIDRVFTMIPLIMILVVWLPCVGASYGTGPGRMMGEVLIKTFRSKKNAHRIRKENREYRRQKNRESKQYALLSKKESSNVGFYQISNQESSYKKLEEKVFTPLSLLSWFYTGR